MATFLDVSLIGSFGSIIVALLVFLIVYALLEYMKPFGDKRGVHGLIALAVALLIMVSNVAANMIKNMVPWFVVLGIFIFFSLFLVRIFGPKESHMIELIKDPNVHPWIIIFIVIILLLSLGNAFGQSLLEKGEDQGTETAEVQVSDAAGASSSVYYTSTGEAIPVTTVNEGASASVQSADDDSTATSSYTTNLLRTLRHPKVLGLIFVFLISALVIIFLTKPALPAS